MRAIVFIALTVFACFGCNATFAGPGGSLDPSTNYADDAEQAYTDAIVDFRDEDCLAAAPAFQRIRREFPFSRFAALSELRIADCRFMQGQYAEAATAYRAFVRFRPSHSQIEYARFRIAESHYEQIPGEWLLGPPSHERDQTATLDALRLMRRFLLDYPGTDNRERATEVIQLCLDELAAHELYAAKFYMRRDAFTAVIHRIQTLLNSYPGASSEPEALLILAEAFTENNEPERARLAYEELVERYPESPQAQDARSALGG